MRDISNWKLGENKPKQSQFEPKPVLRWASRALITAAGRIGPDLLTDLWPSKSIELMSSAK